MAEVKFVDLSAGTPDPWDTVGKALQVAGTVYGIKDAITKNEILQKELDRKNQKEAELNDPNSGSSKLAQQAAQAFFSTAKGMKFLKDNPEAQGHVSALGEFVKGKSAAQINEILDKDPFAKGISASMSKGDSELGDYLKMLTAEKLGQDIKENKQEKIVPGYGSAGTKNDANTAKDALEIYKNLKPTLDAMKKLRSEFGGEVMNRTAVTEAENLGSQYTTQYNRLVAKLGALAGADLGLLEKVQTINPLTINPSVDVNAQLDQAIQQLELGTKNALDKAGFSNASLPKVEALSLTSLKNKKKEEASAPPKDILSDQQGVAAALERARLNQTKQMGLRSGLPRGRK